MQHFHPSRLWRRLHLCIQDNVPSRWGCFGCKDVACLVPCASKTSEIRFIHVGDLHKSTWKLKSAVCKASNYLFSEQTIGWSTSLHQTSKIVPSLLHQYLYESFIFVLSGIKYNCVNYRYNVTIIPYFCSCFEKNWVLTSSKHYFEEWKFNNYMLSSFIFPNLFSLAPH